MRLSRVLLGVIFLAFTFLLACAPQAEIESAEVDVEAIRNINVDLINAFNTGDVEAAVALAMDDAADLPPNRTAIMGKEAIRAFVQSDVDRFTMHFVDEIVEVDVDGDLAVVWSNYSVMLTPKDGSEPIESKGKWIKILKRQPDGSWRFSRNIWNSDNPPHERPN
jgi:uncharacterized protein (TIGR02246 family)